MLNTNERPSGRRYRSAEWPKPLNHRHDRGDHRAHHGDPLEKAIPGRERERERRGGGGREKVRWWQIVARLGEEVLHIGWSTKLLVHGLQRRLSIAHWQTVLYAQLRQLRTHRERV